MTSKLTREVFEAIAAVAAADGRTDDDEVAALLRAARDEGLAETDLEAIEAAARGKGHGPAELGRLSAGDRVFVYAVAYWVSRVDGEMSEEEDQVLGKLGRDLGLADDARMTAEALVDEIAAKPEGDRPARYDLRALRNALTS